VKLVILPPTVKYTLGRLALFLLVFGALLLVPGLDLFLKVMIAILASFGLQFLLLRRWRAEMIAYIDGAVARSRAEKAKLREALAGEDAPTADAAPTGPGPTTVDEAHAGEDAHMGEDAPAGDGVGAGDAAPAGDGRRPDDAQRKRQDRAGR
jgi:hypothetical protein